MIRLIKLSILVTFVFILGCNTKKENGHTIDSEEKDKKTIRKDIVKNTSKVFYLKNEISLPNYGSIFFSNGDEVILFRPTESDFGMLLEETQDQDLLDLDGRFEELTNKVVINFSTNENIKISICEKPIIAIPQATDTLYFDTSKDRYGMMFCKEGKKPIYKSANEENLIQQIKDNYDL